MRLQDELQRHLDSLDDKTRKAMTHPDKVQRILPVHIGANTPLYQNTLAPTSHAATNLYNYANYRVRNIFTRLHKKPEERYPNEVESIEWANAALERYRKNRLASLKDKIRKAEKEGGEGTSEKIEKLEEEREETRKMTALVDEERPYANYNLMDCIFHHHNEPAYLALPASVAQEVLREVNHAWKGFFKSCREYKANPGKFSGRPALPKKRTTGSMSTYSYSQRGWALHEDKETGREYLTLAWCKERIDVSDVFTRKDNHDDLKFQTIECIPTPDGFDLHVSYSYKSCELIAFNERVAGIDFGVDNLITLASNAADTRPLIVDGRLVKSTNRYFNMQNAKISAGYNGCYTSSAKKALWRKRDAQMSNLLGQAANKVRDWLVANRISLLVIGYNKGWKAEGGLAKWDKATKQSFVHIPFASLVNRLRDKCAEVGIRCVTVEESYTSKSSLVDSDILPVYGREMEEYPAGTYARVKTHEVVYPFSGYRRHRGLYRSKNTKIGGKGTLLNADVNGAGNIIRKACPSAFAGVTDWRFLMNPERVRLGCAPLSA